MDFTAKIGGFFRSIINPDGETQNTDKSTEENRYEIRNREYEIISLLSAYFHIQFLIQFRSLFRLKALRVGLEIP